MIYYYNKQLKVVETLLPWPPQPAEQLTCTEKLVLHIALLRKKKPLDMVTFIL